MRELLFMLAALWGVSGAIVIVMFAIDERAHRRSVPPQPHAGHPARGPHALA
ncbi:hypothetical protein [Aeromicrobium wangtongii]|uniref:Uncharacterized protein n=1 Tax=Aeromicrobium wangtongii TaxID=2969247 RepID=A0ABY5M9M5_9ACTN|nr:hypothetical protein [Aeromicrobium wangtongii]MCD9199493.1 hypothetical protein [Aeromicrobium wangtongii]UUP13846.1 hypothetical protein NQV15_00615 [Aeromicrobium wangtongii]